MPGSKIANAEGASSGQAISFKNARDRQYVSNYSMQALLAAMKTAGTHHLQITSTYRSEAEQASIMYANVASRGSASHSMYGQRGRSIETIARKQVAEVEKKQAHAALRSRLFRNAAKTGELDPRMATGPEPVVTRTASQAISEMTLRIYDLEAHHGVGCVSLHQKDPNIVNTIDIGPRSIEPASTLKALVDALTASPYVARIGLPGGMPKRSAKHFAESVNCLHVEIPQPRTVRDGAPDVGNIA